MEPSILAKKYDKIAKWWHDTCHDSQYGIHQIERALKFCLRPGSALDVGCGAGGRFIRILQERGFSVTGIDVSEEMIKLASANHPDMDFLVQDICTWESRMAGY